MLNEILKTLQKNVKEGVPNKLPDKVPNKSELSVLRLLTDNPRLTRIELADFDILHLFSNLVVIYQE